MLQTLSRPRVLLAATVFLAVSFAWAYWQTFEELALAWSSDPQYSHGYFVPVFAVVLLWLRRAEAPKPWLQPSWWGLPILVLTLAGWVYAARYAYLTPDPLSILPVTVGLVLLVGGLPLLKWSWPAIAFLVFMFPLHPRLIGILAEPLQRIATDSSTYALQTLGIPAQADGTVIYLSEVHLGIVEACSGLRMLIVFFALTTAIILVKRPRWLEKTVLLLSVVPIAVVANVIRITVTGVLHETVGSQLANLVFHDLAGWLMILLGIGLLRLELLVLPAFIIVVDTPKPAVAALRLARAKEGTVPEVVAEGGKRASPPPLAITDKGRTAPALQVTESYLKPKTPPHRCGA
jgi:exosortase